MVRRAQPGVVNGSPNKRLREIHLSQQRAESGMFVQRREQERALHAVGGPGAFPHGALQIIDRVLRVTEASVDVSKVI